VPVVSSHGSPVGWVGWSEIIKFFVESIHNNKQVVGPKSHSVTRADLERLATADHKLKLLNAGSKQLKSVHADSPLTKALRLLSKGRQHHVPIVDAKGKLTGVLSQRDVLNYFAAHPEKIGADLRSATVSGLGMGTAHVLSVRESDVALDAFYEIASHNYQGAAVLDNDGRLVNALSVADAGLCEGELCLCL
jgi:CBS domain-containing protein